MAKLTFAKLDYDFDTLVRVAHRLGPFFSIEIRSDDNDWILNWEISQDMTEKSMARIRNEVYDQIIRDKIHAETKPIRDLIFAAAFSNIELK